MEQTNNLVNVIVRENKSVERKIEKTAKRLKRNYEKNRDIDEKKLEILKKPAVKIFSMVFDAITAIVVLMCFVMVFSTISCRLQKVNPSFAGYSQFKVSSGSMKASGFNVGDNIVVRSVDTKTLKVGDKIAFYVNQNSAKTFSKNKSEIVSENTKTKYKVSFTKFFGIQSKEIVSSAKSNCKLVFHEIIEVYKSTETGEHWFKTKGTSNGSPDSWYVAENLVIGIYDNSAGAVFVSKLLTGLTSNKVLVVVVVLPVLLLGMILVLSFLRDAEFAKLELDVVQEKRKLTDEICVKNEIGYKMDTKTKYKVLAQAPDDQKTEYLSLLWKDGSASNALKKYCIRKQLLLSTLKKELDVHRTCDKMFKEGISDKQIAKYYQTEKIKIEKEYRAKQKLMKNMRAITNG